MRHSILSALIALAILAPAACVGQTKPAARSSRPRASAGAEQPGKVRPRVNPKPLSQSVLRGLAWLASSQNRNGGWSQGEESSYMGATMDQLKDKPNVADTCIAALALMRAGSTPKSGPYARNLTAAAKFVCGEIEKSPPQSLSITSIQGTRVQTKLGQYIDTFLAALLLAEVKGHMPDSKLENRVVGALQKTLVKIQQNQRNNGTWDDQGWAPVIGQNFATKALNRAAQRGVSVKPEVLDRAARYSQGQFDGSKRAFGGAGSAGVELYAASANLGAMQQSEITDRDVEVQARITVKTGKTDKERKVAAQTLRRIEKDRKGYQDAQQAVIEKLSDKQFVSGFGSNGGEEFLSYNTIGESLVAKGGSEWVSWDQKITANLQRIQNNDGTWSGHHCITGRTFCTAAALLVLTVDRAAVTLGDAVKRR
ncbi:MAG: hypothetical protein FJX72_04380 [Armatimonadetes bacterium]|nr:hypothetical protein [Armatimonadota bacterium]